MVLLVFAAGLIARLVALSQTNDLDIHIADERQYAALAESLLAGRGFAWPSGELTSLRPPLYPAFLAGLWSVTGVGALQAVRVVQIALALLTAVVAFEIGRRAFDRRAGLIAAAVVWLYPPLLYLNFTILTETLFTLLLTAFVLLAVVVVQERRPGAAIACGVALGLAALTRSVLWPVPLLLCPLLVLLLQTSLARRVALSALVLAGYAVVVGPWAVRNTRLQGVVTIVDTMGGMNLRMGNYEHTPEDRMWDAVSMAGEKSWVFPLTQQAMTDKLAAPMSEGQKEKWAQRLAVEYIVAHPATTLRRAAIKFSDLWGLERSFLAAVQQDVYVLPGWLGGTLALLMVLSSAALILSAAAGVWLARPDWRVHVVLLLPVVLVTAVHTIVFGHSRYHLPLVPVLAVFSAGLLRAGPPRAWVAARPAIYGAAALSLLVVAGWVRQIMVVDLHRVRALLDSI